jgi:hypothetical protein
MCRFQHSRALPLLPEKSPVFQLPYLYRPSAPALLECPAFEPARIPMQFFLYLALALLTAGIIFMLHKGQLRKRREMIDRSTPLAVVDVDFSQPPVELVSEPDTEQESWLEQVKRLRESGQDQAALSLSQQQFPRVQAFQQAAIILRHLIRDLIEQHRPVRDEMQQLYRIAVMADLYRNSNVLKPSDPGAALQSLQGLDFDYKSIGTRHLRLLTKSDMRHLEQLWGRPHTHQHAEDALREHWLPLCQ